LEPLRPALVACGRERMLTAVDFHNQSRREADEVDDVGAEWVLSPESTAVDLMTPKMVP
jgi:hypothetical protein